jgi:hypothetical protein
MGRVNGSDAGRKAKPVWLCANCRMWHRDYDAKGKLIKPFDCKFCHQTEFDYFHSSGEAQAWCSLHLRARAGEVRNLRRQIKRDLMTVGKQGLACKWGEIILDFDFEELQGDDWLPVAADYKPADGMSPDAALKIRCLEAMGTPVRIITSKGEV